MPGQFSSSYIAYDGGVCLSSAAYVGGVCFSSAAHDGGVCCAFHHVPIISYL